MKKRGDYTQKNNHDEEMADLMERANIDWNVLKGCLTDMSTEELMRVTLDLNLYVNKTIALEIVGRKDAVFWIRKFLQDCKNWYYYNGGDRWFPVHAAHFLALAKSEEAFRLLLDIVRYRGGELGDSLTEDAPSLLVYFGEDYTEKLKEFAPDETLEPFARGAAITALLTLAKKFPSHKGGIKGYFLKLFRSTKDKTFAGLIASDILSFRDPSVLPEIKKAFDEGRTDKDILNENDIKESLDSDYEEVHDKNPLEHFSRKNIEHFHRISSEEKEKTGRNEPCPCGSGKKYKRCCGK